MYLTTDDRRHSNNRTRPQLFKLVKSTWKIKKKPGDVFNRANEYHNSIMCQLYFCVGKKKKKYIRKIIKKYNGDRRKPMIARSTGGGFV